MPNSLHALLTMPRVAKASKPADSTANLGFEATAMRGSAFIPCAAVSRSLRVAKDNRSLAADSRGEAETAEGHRSNITSSAA